MTDSALLQAAELAGLQVGDLILVQKVEQYDSDDDGADDNDDADQDDEAASGGENDGGDEDGEVGEDGEDGEDGEGEGSSESESEGEDNEGYEQLDSDSTDPSEVEIPVPPRVYTVTSVKKDGNDIITDLEVAHLQFSSTVSNGDHKYHIYGEQVVHNHPSTCSDCETTKVADLIKTSYFRIHAKPNGDFVRGLDQDIWIGNPHTRCITGCTAGFLSHGHDLQDMIANYSPPTLATGMPVPQSYQPPLCPVCIGIDHFKEQQMMQANMMLMGFIDIGTVIEFLGRVNLRRTELGYAFEQFDEREWGYAEFDDMLSDDELGDGDGDGRWQDWADAMDPNNEVQNHPASDATIASLARKFFENVKVDTEVDITECKVCQEKFQEGNTLLELPCGHLYYHEDCIVPWLKQFDTCPTCRRAVPPVPEAGNA